MKFGLSLRTSADADVAADAREAERLGFQLVTAMDHLHGSHPSLETWTALTWAAAATERIRISPNVLGLPYRHPAVTGKMAATLQQLSGGRLILGLGAGGSNREFEAFGLPVRSPKEKIDAFEEAITIIRGLWTGEPQTLEGAHYAVKEAQITPPPDPPIPLWLGTYGPRSLAITGRLADGWLPSYRYAMPDVYPAMRDRVSRAAESAGRDPDALEYAYNVGVRVDEKAEAREGMIAGPPEKVTTELAELAEMGVTFLVIWAAGDQAEQRERLAAEVIPALSD
jgi:alkanesulfonate monooxygenase SsuD/methylene tetrahydromethanopterin reductase-like flavin-dependent oxidoreductase (luciferase family)